MLRVLLVSRRREAVYRCYRTYHPDDSLAVFAWSGFVEERFCVFLPMFDSESEARAAAAAVPSEMVR